MVPVNGRLYCCMCRNRFLQNSQSHRLRAYLIRVKVTAISRRVSRYSASRLHVEGA